MTSEGSNVGSPSIIRGRRIISYSFQGSYRVARQDAKSEYSHSYMNEEQRSLKSKDNGSWPKLFSFHFFDDLEEIIRFYNPIKIKDSMYSEFFFTIPLEENTNLPFIQISSLRKS